MRENATGAGGVPAVVVSAADAARWRGRRHNAARALPARAAASAYAVRPSINAYNGTC